MSESSAALSGTPRNAQHWTLCQPCGLVIVTHHCEPCCMRTLIVITASTSLVPQSFIMSWTCDSLGAMLFPNSIAQNYCKHETRRKHRSLVNADTKNCSLASTPCVTHAQQLSIGVTMESRLCCSLTITLLATLSVSLLVRRALGRSAARVDSS
jgi:hypothetical protein